MIYFQVVVILLELALLAAIAALLVSHWRGLTFGNWATRTGDIFIYLSVAIFFASGISKLLGFAPAAYEMRLLGFTGAPYVAVACIELTSGLLLLIRPLRSLAILFIAAHVGGAISAHLIAGQYFAMLPSAVILTLCVLGLFLRHPIALWSLSGIGASRVSRSG